MLPSLQGALQKLGVGADGVKSAPLSGEPDLLKGASPQANQLIQSGVEAMYSRFLGIVAAARHKTPQRVDQITKAGGRRTAPNWVVGGSAVSDAVAKAAQLANLATSTECTPSSSGASATS